MSLAINSSPEDEIEEIALKISELPSFDQALFLEELSGRLIHECRSDMFLYSYHLDKVASVLSDRGILLIKVLAHKIRLQQDAEKEYKKQRIVFS